MRLPDPERSRAVLLGIGAYRHHPALPGAQEGALALREVLTDPLYGSLKPENCVLLPENVGREAAGRAIMTAADHAEELLLFYFAGHGELGRRRSDLHLMLSGTHTDDMAFSGLKYDDIRDVVLDSDARSKIVILDCCYSGSALGHDMSGEASLVDEVDIEGTAVLTSAPPHAKSRILDSESYPAYTGRLLMLLREGIEGEPELLTLPVLHRHLCRAVRAAGLRPPQAKLNPLLDQLGLVRNKAGRARTADQATGAGDSFELRPRPAKPPEPPAHDEPIPAEKLERLAQSANPRDRADAYNAVLSGLANGRIAPQPSAGVQMPPRQDTPIKPSPVGPLRSFLSFVLKPAIGAYFAFLAVALFHDLVSSDVEDEFGVHGGYIAVGIATLCLAAVLTVVVEWRAPRRGGILGAGAVGGFVAALGVQLAFGVVVWPLVTSTLAVMGCVGSVRFLRQRATPRQGNSAERQVPPLVDRP